MKSSISRSLALVCGSLTMALTACIGSPDVEEDLDSPDVEEENTATTADALAATQLMKTESVKAYMRAMWKKELNTAQDPANNKWFTTGADGGNPAGLYGALVLTPDSAITVDNSKRTYSSSTAVEDYCVANNKNGLNPKLNCTLTSTVTQSVATTHGVQDAIELGASYAVKGSATLFGLGAEATTTFSAKYTHTWSSSTTTTGQVANAFATTCATDVPKGKVYKCVLRGVIRNFSAPYTVVAKVSGFTETWFASQVSGHYNYALSGGSAFQRIKDWNLAGSSSSSFSSAGFTQKGTLAASTRGSFSTAVYDVTSSYAKASMPNSAVGGASPANAKSLEEEGTLVKVVPIAVNTLPEGLTIAPESEKGEGL